MNKIEIKSFAFILLLLLPVTSFAAVLKDGDFHTYAVIISWANVVLYISSAICIKQYFFLGSRNQTNFQIFNLIFGILFYALALAFLVNQRSFYVGFEQLSQGGCIKKFFIGDGIYSWLQWMVLTALLINILYISKYHDK